jgi:hypothetical protein
MKQNQKGTWMKTNSKEPVKELTLAEQESMIKEEIQRFLKIAKEKGSSYN